MGREHGHGGRGDSVPSRRHLQGVHPGAGDSCVEALCEDRLRHHCAYNSEIFNFLMKHLALGQNTIALPLPPPWTHRLSEVLVSVSETSHSQEFSVFGGMLAE